MYDVSSLKTHLHYTKKNLKIKKRNIKNEKEFKNTNDYINFITYLC